MIEPIGVVEALILDDARCLPRRKSQLSLFVMLLVCGLLFSISRAPAQDEFEKGMEFLEKSRYDEAHAAFGAYLEANPDHPEALYYMGTLEIDGAASQKYFRTLWINHPTHPLADGALYAIAQYHYAKGYYVTAGKMFRDLVKTYPESEYADNASYWSGSSHLAAEHPDSALIQWQEFLSRYPKSDLYDWAVLGAGDALSALQRYDEARSEYEKIIDSPFGEDLKSAALYRLGQSCKILGDTTSARRYYDRIEEQFSRSYERSLVEGETERRAFTSRHHPGTYTVQVGAFAHKENAIKLHDALAQKGYDVEIVSKSIEDGSSFHAVQVGSFSSREEAQIIAERLEKEEGFQPRIVPKNVQ